MNTTAYRILRIGLGITFVWVGVLILLEPTVWAGFLQPWAAELLPFPVIPMMIGTGILDIVIGVLLVLNLFTWLAALVGGLHLLVVLVTTGISNITVRDIGLLAAAFALFFEKKPTRSVR